MTSASERTAAADLAKVPQDVAYWDGVAREWAARGNVGAWRTVCDAVNRDLIDRWLTPVPGGRVLKTDLFDELVGEGLTATLGRRFGVVSGIDVSPTLVELVRARHPLLDVHAADVRHLPFPDGTFNAVCSDSTLDHFDSAADIADALAEIRRALRRGGTLLVTLDNGMNPLVAVRNAMPERWRQASRLVPYAVGVTCRRPRDLRALLERSGFEVTQTGAILHCPRVLAVMAGNAVDRHGSERVREAYSRTLLGFERLSRLPTRFVTGHFLAALAIKR